MLKLVVTIVIPYLLLTRLGDLTDLEPRVVLLVALAFPIGYMLLAMSRRREIGIAPTVGLVSVLLTGGVGMLADDPTWLAVKEAAVPGLFGLAILISGRTSRPIVGVLIDKVVGTDAVRAALAQRGAEERWRRFVARATVLWATVLLIAAVLNYALARIVVTSPGGTAAFNEELGRMTALSVPVVTLPMMVMMSATVWYIVRGVTRLTGLPTRQVARGTYVWDRIDGWLRPLTFGLGRRQRAATRRPQRRAGC